MILDDHQLFWLLLAINLIGLLTMGIARIGAKSRVRVHCQYLFFAGLLLVGLFTFVALSLGTHQATGGMATLAAMVLGATLDLGSKQAVPF